MPYLRVGNNHLFRAAARPAASLTQQHASQIKMAPKNNKGKAAKEPEKTGAAKVKGG
jgi:hypothetical protein